MLGLDACELGAQLLELLRLALCARGEQAGLGPGWPRGRGSRAGKGGWGGFSLGRGLGLPRGNFGGARGEILARSPYWALAGVGGLRPGQTLRGKRAKSGRVCL